jgi:hypothetical protein
LKAEREEERILEMKRGRKREAYTVKIFGKRGSREEKF